MRVTAALTLSGNLRSGGWLVKPYAQVSATKVSGKASALSSSLATSPFATLTGPGVLTPGTTIIGGGTARVNETYGLARAGAVFQLDKSVDLQVDVFRSVGSRDRTYSGGSLALNIRF